MGSTRWCHMNLDCPSKGLAVAFTALLAGCSPVADLYGVQQGYLTVGEQAEGYLTWTFFEAEWGKDRSEEHYRCGRLMSLVGEPAATDSTCPGCSHLWELELLDLEHDCPGGEGTREDLIGPLRMGIGDLPESSSAHGPFPDQSKGWWGSWDGGPFEPFGTSFPESLISGEGPKGGAEVQDGDRLVLWPGEARAF
jgi:hypothetical protein